MHDYEFNLPIYGVIKKTKNNSNCAITFNWACAANRWEYSKAKKRFKVMISKQLDKFDKIEGKLSINYVYYAKRKGTDLDNFISIVKKYFQDALSESGLIVDDNCSVIVRNSEEYAGIDKDNPRVMAFINVVL